MTSTSEPAKATLTVRTLRPGDLGWILQRHGELYDREYGLDLDFERYVLLGLASFAEKPAGETDRIWIAELAGRRVGAIAVVGAAPGVAQLRWFLVEPDARGRGVGRRLIETALDFCRSRNVRSIFLWTLQDLTAARHLYEAYGFALREQKTHLVWGRVLTEEMWSLDCLGS